MDATVPVQLRFRLLGEATLSVAGADNHRVLPQKGLALLVYLAMNRGRTISRAVLADLLWGDRVDSQARQSLRQCILTLRRDFGPALGRALVVEDQSLALAVDGVEVDALQFVTCTVPRTRPSVGAASIFPGDHSSALFQSAQKASTNGRLRSDKDSTRLRLAHSRNLRNSSIPLVTVNSPSQRWSG